MAKRPAKRQTRASWGQRRKERSGRFSASYIGPDGRRHRAPVTFSTRLDADAWLAGERNSISQGTWSPPADPDAETESADPLPTLSDYAARWLAQRQLAPRTRDNYATHLRLHILPVLGEYHLDELSADDVREWFSQLNAEYSTRNGQAYGVLTAMLSTAVDDGLIARSPARIAGANKSRARRSVELLTAAELAALADAMPDRLRVSVLLAGWCALRRGELFSLTRAQVAPDCSAITIDRAVTYRAGRFEVGPPKTVESNRVVTVPPHVRGELRRHLDTHVESSRDALLFADPVSGGHLVEHRYRTPFFAARTAIGRPGLHLHDLRHFGGVMAAQSGATTREVMGRLGHTTSVAALRYQHVADGRAELLADRLSELAQPRHLRVVGDDG